jgi:hypothetical protein
MTLFFWVCELSRTKLGELAGAGGAAGPARTASPRRQPPPPRGLRPIVLAELPCARARAHAWAAAALRRVPPPLYRDFNR